MSLTYAMQPLPGALMAIGEISGSGSPLFNVSLESGNLTGDGSSFDSAVTGGGDLAVAAPGLRGTGNLMRCTINDTTAIYGERLLSPPASGEMRFRFYLDPSGLTMGASENFAISRVIAVGLAAQFFVVSLSQGSPFNIFAQMRTDADTPVTSSSFSITADEHYVEFLLSRATSNVASDGEYEIWVDGVLKETKTGIDNYDLWDDMVSIRLGATAFLDAGTGGDFDVDELVVRVDATPIGA